MKKRDWLIITLPLLATWLIDRMTKLWATGLTEIKSYGLVHFVLQHNHGAMLGLFSDLPFILRVVSLSTAGAFLLCTYILIQYLLPIRSLTLRSGLSILIGGIIGNVTDRIVWGYVVDFLVVGPASFSSPVFNLADFLQWVGYGMIVVAIIREGELLWPEFNYRKKYWINNSFQLKYCFILMAVGISLALICLVFSYTYMEAAIKELIGNNAVLINKFMTPYLITFLIICVAFCAILFAVGQRISHRIAGPLYAFEKFLTHSLEGTATPLKLRSSDEFKHLEVLAKKIHDRLQEIKTEGLSRVVESPESPEKNK